MTLSSFYRSFFLFRCCIFVFCLFLWGFFPSFVALVSYPLFRSRCLNYGFLTAFFLHFSTSLCPLYHYFAVLTFFLCRSGLLSSPTLLHFNGMYYVWPHACILSMSLISCRTCSLEHSSPIFYYHCEDVMFACCCLPPVHKFYISNHSTKQLKNKPSLIFFNQSIFAFINNQSTKSTHIDSTSPEYLNKQAFNQPTNNQPINELYKSINIHIDKQPINQIYTHKHSTNQPNLHINTQPKKI